MTKQHLHSALAPIDVLTRDELEQSLHTELDAAVREQVRGIGMTDFRMQTTVTGGAFSMGALFGDMVGPESGYLWSVMALTIEGLATGAAPDIANVYKNDFTNPVFWQLNGNNFGVTFNKLSKIIKSGEYLVVQNLGAVAAVNGTLIRLSGTAMQVPQEMVGKLV